MPTLEHNVEKPVVEWAKTHRRQVIVWKLTIRGWAGLPDRMFLFNGARVVFVEFKRPGKKPRKLQGVLMRRLAEMGFPCYAFDNTDNAIATLEQYL